jgi:hypothetical protein
LALDEAHINIQIDHFRKQIIKALPQVVQEGQQMRFAYDNIHIKELD